jgi:histidinol-phosphate aminotransferase
VSYERDAIRRMAGYTWGEQPSDTTTLKLNTNENPYPPSPQVAKALANFDVNVLRRYPQPTADGFRSLVASRFSVETANVLVANGGDEVLRLAFTTFLDAGDVFATTDPSYSLYPVLAAIADCTVSTVALNDDWTLPRDFAQQLNDAGARLACLVNPHAPSGHLADVDTLARVANEFDGVLLIDEAYVDFVDPSLRHDSVKLIRAFDNVLLLRTLSKGYSLAGLRFGFALGPAALIDPILTKTRDSYNMDAISQALGSAAFADLEYAEQTWSAVRQQRRELREGLIKRNFTVPYSQTNFVLATPPLDQRVSAIEIFLALKEREILVRHFSEPRLEDKLRITVGDETQNATLLTAIDDVLAN